MRVVLLNPPSNLIQRGEHLGLGYLAAVLRRAGHEVEIVDAFLCEQNVCQVLAILNDRSFDLLGVTINAANLSSALTLSRIVALGDERCHIVFGGIQATLCYETLLQTVPWLDWVVLGEGERTLVELVNCLDEGRDWQHVPGLAYRQGDRVITTPPRELISDLDELPFPARDLLDEAQSRGWSCYISSSRGCHWQCSFCAIRAAYRFTPGKRWRARSIQNTVDEMETLYRERGINDFYFVDDNFLGPGKRGKERARLLAQEILKRSIHCKLRFSCRASDVDQELFSLLKEAGLVEVFIGVESGVERALGTFNKGVSAQDSVQALTILTNLRIKCDVGFILLDPFTSIEEIAENLAFLRQFDGAYVCLHNVTASLEVHEGTPIQILLASQGLLTGSPLGWQYQAIDPRVETLRRLAAKRGSSPLKLLMSIWRVKEQVSEGSPLELKLNRLLQEIQQVEICYTEQLLDFVGGGFQEGDPVSIEEDTRSSLRRISHEFEAIAAEFNLDSPRNKEDNLLSEAFWERAYRKAGKIWRQDPHPKVVELAMQLELEGCHRVLDLGCGSGRHCHYLARRSFEAVGIDVSYSALTTARLTAEAGGLSQALFAQASADGLPFPNATFDAAVSYGGVLSFLHNSQLPQAVAEIIRVLKKGGFFLATVFSTADHSYGLGQEVAPRTFQNHDLLCHFFIEEEIQNLLRSFDLIALDHFVIEDTTHDQPHLHGCWQIQARRRKRLSEGCAG